MSTDQPRVNYRVLDRDQKYYIFDWDDNILHMPTMIYLERRVADDRWEPCAVSTAMFSVIRSDSERYRPVGGDWDEACRDFRDVEQDSENVFLRDTRLAIDRVVSGENPAAPSFLRFKQTLIEGRLFAIITARGHAPEIIRAGVEYFMDRVISSDDREKMLFNLRGYVASFEPTRNMGSDVEVLDCYLGLNRYHGIRSSHFRELTQECGHEVLTTEGGKQFAIREFVEHIIRVTNECGISKPISVGFSDDDVQTAQAVEAFLRSELGPAYPGVKFAVYYTSDPEHPTGRKVEVQGQLSLPFEAQ